jgi:hypothetical protein
MAGKAGPQSVYASNLFRPAGSTGQYEALVGAASGAYQSPTRGARMGQSHNRLPGLLLSAAYCLEIHASNVKQ